ncbi:MAG TPA: excinuclease ABC subunit UvrA [Nitrospirae bacterium]|nr:excinuclease ABC subunit UvrA [Nitrospirota bacterium]
MSIKELLIEGAKQNNLKNLTLRLPHNKMIAITGLSGSGKSSLAFDTIFAEGQWRFIESLSTYARIFIEKINRPDVDKMLNIRPAIALEQHNPIKTSRSTVGTLTEIYDLLRIIYAKVSRPYCPQCGRELKKWHIQSIAEILLKDYQDGRAIILAKTRHHVKELIRAGYERLWDNNQIIDIGDYKGDLETYKFIVVDRLVIREDERLYDSIRTAWKEGGEEIAIVLFPKEEDLNKDKTELIFSSQLKCDYCNITAQESSPSMFSFSHPAFACPRCKGFGNILRYDERNIIPDTTLSLKNGAIAFLQRESLSDWKEQFINGVVKSGIDINKPYQSLRDDEKELLFTGNSLFIGLNDLFSELETQRYKVHIRALLSRYRVAIICPDCNGKRLIKDSLIYKINNLDISELSKKTINLLIDFFERLDITEMQRNVIKEPLRQLMMKLNFLNRVGLGYLTLDRQSKTLSGGEYQRLNLSNQLASQLTGTLYVLDEPTIGLHPSDTDRIIGIMRELVNLGNTVIVVEHDKDIIKQSDFVVEMGPGGGAKGGEVVFSGYYRDFEDSDVLTAKALRKERLPNYEISVTRLNRRNIERFLLLKGAKGNNLKNINITIPLESLTVVTGVSGSGKSSLIVETLYPAMANYFKIGNLISLPFESIKGLNLIRGVKLIDQSPIGKTPRSNPATYLKVFDWIRKIFAQQPESRAYGYSQSFFSFNIKGGRCELCKGEGFQKIDMYFFEDLYVKCEACQGSRYSKEALRVFYNGKNISDVLNMTISDAKDFFKEHIEVYNKLNLLEQIGLGYLRLGQPANTLSGGEAQRLKICSELIGMSSFSLRNQKGMFYILDEPTVGLHYYDVMMFMNIIFMLLRARNTVLIIEHNLDVISLADHVIDLGPEGGERGGNIVFEGTPFEILNCQASITGQYLKKFLNGNNNNTYKR